MKWISVKDRLPENDTCILAYGKLRTGGGFNETVTYMNDTWYGDFLNKTEMGGYITHWMELPKPPDK